MNIESGSSIVFTRFGDVMMSSFFGLSVAMLFPLPRMRSENMTELDMPSEKSRSDRLSPIENAPLPRQDNTPCVGDANVAALLVWLVELLAPS